MIAQFILCLFQFCVVLEQQPYVVYSSKESCEQAAFAVAKEFETLLKDKTIETIAFRCVDKTNNFI